MYRNKEQFSGKGDRETLLNGLEKICDEDLGGIVCQVRTWRINFWNSPLTTKQKKYICLHISLEANKKTLKLKELELDFMDLSDVDSQVLAEAVTKIKKIMAGVQ